MANISYLFGDVVTGAVLEEISLQGVSMTRGFGQGELRGSFQLDQTGKINADLLAATEEGRSYVICLRDNQPVWGGVVWTRTYQSQAKVFQLYCRAFEHYPENRIILSDIEYTDIEQRNIFLNLWTSMMTDANSLQVTLPSSFSTLVTKSLTVKTSEYKKYSQAMDSVANGDTGFDWTIDVALVDGAFTKTLRIGYPSLGSTEPLVMYYSGEIMNYWRNGSMNQRGTHFYGIGAGEGSTVLTQEVIHTDLVASRFPRYDVAVSYKEVNNATLLTALTTQIALTLKAGVQVYTIEVKGNIEPEFGSYGLGDSVKVYFSDPLHPNSLISPLESRILGWEYYPGSDDHVEYARLVMQGGDL